MFRPSMFLLSFEYPRHFLRLKDLRSTSVWMSPHYYQQALQMVLFFAMDLVPIGYLEGIGHGQLGKCDQHVRKNAILL